MGSLKRHSPHRQRRWVCSRRGRLRYEEWIWNHSAGRLCHFANSEPLASLGNKRVVDWSISRQHGVHDRFHVSVAHGDSPSPLTKEVAERWPFELSQCTVRLLEKVAGLCSFS